MSAARTTRGDRELGQRIARARRAAGFTQRRLAEALGFSKAWLGNIEAGHRSIDALDLLRLAREIGVTAGALLGEGPSELSEFRRLHRHLQELNEDDRRVLMSAFEASAKAASESRREEMYFRWPLSEP